VVVEAMPREVTPAGEPIAVPPTSNWTFPAGRVPSAAVMVAVSFTGVSTAAGLGDAVNVTDVVVVAGAMTAAEALEPRAPRTVPPSKARTPARTPAR